MLLHFKILVKVCMSFDIQRNVSYVIVLYMFFKMCALKFIYFEIHKN
jgi:hypothetical protein